MPDTVDEARKLIETRLAEIDAEARSLKQAIVGLGERAAGPRGGAALRGRWSTGATSPAATAPKRRGHGRQKAGKRAAPGQRQAELLAAIKADPGVRPADLARAVGIRPAHVHALIAKARTEKLIKKSGKGYAPKG
jgi:hypothetical protein